MNKIYFKIAIVLLISGGCEVKPVEINYGSDACHFCKMTIVDKQYASQIVTVKGKAFKYDAIECMMNDYAKWQEPTPELFLVTDFSNPGNLVDAKVAHYLISKELPSPMGASLTAFEKDDHRNSTLDELGGEKLDWNLLLNEFH